MPPAPDERPTSWCTVAGSSTTGSQEPVWGNSEAGFHNSEAVITALMLHHRQIITQQHRLMIYVWGFGGNQKTHQSYGIFTLWWIITVFWSFHAGGSVPRRESRTRVLHLWYVKPHGLGYAWNVAYAGHAWHPISSTRECWIQMRTFSPLRGELHAGMAEGLKESACSCSHSSSGGEGKR